VRALGIALAVAAAVAAIVVANVVLLGYGSERSNRVGELSPLAPPTHSAPATTTTTPVEPGDDDAQPGGEDADLDD
jgi:hypothetical protein